MFNIITLEQKVPKKTRFGDYEPIIEHFIKFDIMKIKDSKVGTNFKGGSPPQMRTSSVKFTGNTSSAMKLNKKAEAEITKEEGKNKTLPVWHKKFNEWRGQFTGNTLQKMYGQWQKNGNSFKIQESNDEYQKRWTDELWAGYEKQLNQIAKTLKETTDQIPEDINWIIQVEGHTDKRPISTLKFPSNWELSTARANSVLKFLLKNGFSPNRLSAAGYGEFYPITLGETEEDYRQNRRIELKLTAR